MNEKILVIDDDLELNSLLTDYLTNNGFVVHTVDHPDDGLDYLVREIPDVVILDVMLPDMDGFSVCKEIRKSSSVPIIMLTAKGDVHDRIVGLEIGADDYMPKPFEPRELLARLRSILRRSGETLSPLERECFGTMMFDRIGMKVTVSGRDANLTTGEFTLLACLIDNRGRVLNRNQMVEKLRGIDWDASDRSIDMYISRIRQKIGDDPRKPSYIKTVIGTGYVFIGKTGSGV